MTAALARAALVATLAGACEPQSFFGRVRRDAAADALSDAARDAVSDDRPRDAPARFNCTGQPGVARVGPFDLRAEPSHVSAEPPVQVAVGGPWSAGRAVAFPAARLFVADPECAPGGGVRRIDHLGPRDGGPAFSSRCVEGPSGVRGVNVGTNNNRFGLCLDLLDEAGAGFATALLETDFARASVRSSERAAWTATRCAFDEQMLGVIAVDAAGRRTFRTYSTEYHAAGDPAPLEPSDRALTPAALLRAASWFTFWNPSDDTTSARLDRISLTGEVVTSESMDAWFAPGARVRTLAVTHAGGGARAVLSVRSGARAEVYLAQVCANGQRSLRRVIDAAPDSVLWVTPSGLSFLFMVEGGRVVALQFDGEDRWQAAPVEIARGDGLALLDVTPSDDPRFLSMWTARPVEGGRTEIQFRRVDIGP